VIRLALMGMEVPEIASTTGRGLRDAHAMLAGETGDDTVAHVFGDEAVVRFDRWRRREAAFGPVGARSARAGLTPKARPVESQRVNRSEDARRTSRLEGGIDRGGGRGDVARPSGSSRRRNLGDARYPAGRDAGRRYVALRGIPDLRQVEVRENEVSIGTAITHAGLAASLQRVRGCAGLAQAAAQAANPAIRRVATVGGNLCSLRGFRSNAGAGLGRGGGRD
jgi:hypothetical protein